MINPTEKDIGRKVIYQGGHPGDREEGVITSFNDYYIFGRFVSDAGETVAFMSRASHESRPALGAKMAAGEELLEALENLFHCVNIARPRKLDDALTWRQNDHRVKVMVEAAIKKATGAAP
jgi:hypothetical protein